MQCYAQTQGFHIYLVHLRTYLCLLVCMFLRTSKSCPHPGSRNARIPSFGLLINRPERPHSRKKLTAPRCHDPPSTGTLQPNAGSLCSCGQLSSSTRLSSEDTWEFPKNLRVLSWASLDQESCHFGSILGAPGFWKRYRSVLLSFRGFSTWVAVKEFDVSYHSRAKS